MDLFENRVAKIYRLPDKSLSKDILITLGRICYNIIEHPTEQKYKRISKRSKHVEHIVQNEDAFEILYMIGFRKEIVDFEEHYTLQHVSANDKARLKDIYDLLVSYADKLPEIGKEEQKTNYDIAKERKAAHEKRVQDILFQAEQDRKEVKERNEQYIRKLKKK